MSHKSVFAILSFALLTLAGCVGEGGVEVKITATPIPPITPPVSVPVTLKPIPTVALTFDYYGSTYTNAYPLLKARGLVGTFYVDPDTIDNGQPTTAQLQEMYLGGWSIQGYSGLNMASLLATSGPNAVMARFNDMKSRMTTKGFNITSIAPSSRAWNNQLRDLAVGSFTSVRANNDTTVWQSYPIPDPMYVKQGATASLSNTDTVASLTTQLNSLEATEGLWVVVVHKVGDDADPAFSVQSAVFATFLDRLAADVKAGKVRVTTFDRALAPVWRVQ